MTQYMGFEIKTDILTKRGIGEIENKCNRAGGEDLRDLLPSHFEENSQQKYKYQRRDGGYTKRKRRVFGHGRPLVFRGNLRAAVLSSARVTATRKQATVTARGSRRSNLKAQFKAEIEKVTKGQENKISKDWRDRFISLSADNQYRKKKHWS